MGTVNAAMGPGDDKLTVGNNLTTTVTAHGNAGNDQLIGGPFAVDSLCGDDGNDQLQGRAGDYTLDLGPGSDWGNGDEGDDHLLGSPDDDHLAGGSESDTIDGGTAHDDVGADHVFNGGYTYLTAAPQGDDTILFREDTPERDEVFAGTDVLMGGCGGGDDHVVADVLDSSPRAERALRDRRPAGGGVGILADAHLA